MSDEVPEHYRLRDYIEMVGLGVFLGLVLVAVCAIALIFAPMLIRRYQMGFLELPLPLSGSVLPVAEAAGHDSLDVPDDQPVDGEGRDMPGSSRLPQIEWESILTEEEQRNMAALREDVRDMTEAPAHNLFIWPTLPYPVTASPEQWDDRFELLSKLLDGVYNEEPELTVYTNGQSVSSVVTVAKYHLIEAEKASPDTNREEYDTVVRAADELDAKIRAMLTGPECRAYVDTGRCSEDELYVMLLYRELASISSYSDDIDDTPHANDIYGALIEGESKCYGVASAAKALLNRRGIPSFMASGSMDHDDDRRHAWVILWIGNQWKTIDITYAQSQDAPDTLDVDAALMGMQGYWGGCMRSYQEYVEQNNMKVDQQCLELMAAYEKTIGDIPYNVVPEESTMAA